jgi:hypothetical protein
MTPPEVQMANEWLPVGAGSGTGSGAVAIMNGVIATSTHFKLMVILFTVLIFLGF